jgi:hypothetical protein
MSANEVKEDLDARQKAGVSESEPQAGKTEDMAEKQIVTAKDLPQPSTALDSPRKRALDKIRVSLAAELPPISSMSEIEEINGRNDYDSRTPLTTVLLSALEDAGGTMKLTELAEKAARLWNRPFPSSPYTREEFIYLVIRSSDYILIEEN